MRSTVGRDESGQTRTQRRVERTRAAIEAAFLRLASDRGYRDVTMEDVAEAADVAKATLYSLYANREALLAAVFARLTNELAERVAYRDGPWTEVRTGAMTAVYEHAAQMRDLYRVCLAEPVTRELYLSGVAAYAEDNNRQRLAALGREPRVPIEMTATMFAGAHVALLDAWLAGRLSGTPQQMAATELDMLIAGLAWAHNLTLDEVGYGDKPATAT